MSQTDFAVDKDKLEVRLERVFNASPERLFQAMTDPQQIPMWWGPAKYETKVDKMDVRVGGAWRYIHDDNEGGVFAFNGIYKEIDQPHKLVNTFEFEPMAGHILEETHTLEDMGDGKTKLTTISRYENIEDLEGMVQSGMESGAVESMERLAVLVETA